MNHTHRMSILIRMLGLLVTVAVALASSGLAQSPDPDTVTTLGSTVPANGDVNPYGVALIPRTTGSLVQGNFLVSNFNNAPTPQNTGGQQGTGTTIVQMQPNGSMELFAQIDPSSVSCPGGVGLTTALVALRSGFVVVGSLPTTDGTAATAQAGCLLVLNSKGKVVRTISGHHINGPWDMTAVDGGEIFALFVTNVLNGTVAGGGNLVNKGTVVRLVFVVDDGAPQLLDSSIIAAGFPERTDPAALVIGPTGVAFDPATGNLLVADSLDNRIAAIPNALFRSQTAGTGRTVSAGGALNDPLGVSLSGHDLFVANGNDGNIVEVNIRTGRQIDVDLVDSSGGPPPGAGALFGLWALKGEVYFVDDATNTFNLLH
jgi:DNA-binding beta-propeller fold protein YncE